MNVLKSLLENFLSATVGMLAIAAVNLLVWGEHLRSAALVWLLILFLVFLTLDVIKWGTNKFYGSK